MTTSTTTWPADVKPGARVKFTYRTADVAIVGVVDEIDRDGEVFLVGDVSTDLYPDDYTAEVVTPAPPVIPTEPGFYVKRGDRHSALYRLTPEGVWLFAVASDGYTWIKSGGYRDVDLVALKVAE